MGSIYGDILRVATFGESHGAAVGVVIDGLPAGVPVELEHIQAELDRRRPGQNKFTTQRREADQVRVLSGVFEGRATGTPLALVVDNADQRSGDYEEMKALYRPSHADFTYDLKYGFRDHRGGGRSSAREAIARVAAGALARRLLEDCCGTRIVAYVERIEHEEVRVDALAVTVEEVEASAIRCSDPEAGARMEKAILAARGDGDSVGGTIRLVVHNPPLGAGEPVFDRCEAELAKAMLSIPATKGFEVGSGFAGTYLRGSAHNDPFVPADPASGRVAATTKNDSGGVQGGIANGEPIVARIAFKPTATISSPQQTVDREGNPGTLQARGRHDPCVLPRAVVVVEAMAALVLADLFLRQRARTGLYTPA